MTRRGAGQKRKHSEALAPTLPAEDVEEVRARAVPVPFPPYPSLVDLPVVEHLPRSM
jgi:hypothetical protein